MGDCFSQVIRKFTHLSLKQLIRLGLGDCQIMRHRFAIDPGCAIANGPWIAARQWVRVGLELTPFKFFDQLKRLT